VQKQTSPPKHYTIETLNNYLKNPFREDKAALAEKAIPNCNICCVDGEEGIAYMKGVLEVLFAANPKSVGGKLPTDEFYGK
jgi:hypothetical protein